MTIKRNIKTAALLLAAAMLTLPAQAAQRAKTYSEAIGKAGSDGVVVFCYGPDWNRRSVRMLDEFWKSPETEEACGNAVMVAVPFYQDPEADTKNEASEIASGAPKPPYSVCPTVIMVDKNGRTYANLVGTDYLGDYAGALGAKNIRDRLAHLRRQQELLGKMDSVSSEEKVKMIQEISEMPIARPENLTDLAKAADPSDASGIVRRLNHDPLQFMYKLLDTTDGFLKPDYEADFKKIKDETQRAANDKALLPLDRQKALALQVGEARRQGNTGNKITGITKEMAKIAAATDYGKLADEIGKKWSSGHKPTSAQKAAARDAQREKDKEKKAKKIQERKAEKTIQID